MLSPHLHTFLFAAASLIWACGSAQARDWSSAWQAPQSDAFLSQPLAHASVREVLTPHAGGEAIRLRVSNQYGAQSIKIGAASVAPSAGGAKLASPPLPITFGGSTELDLAPGQSRYSDPVPLPVHPMERLAVSLFVRNAVLSASRHFTGNEYVWTAAGDRTTDVMGTGFGRNSNALQASHVLVDRLDVLTDASATTPVRVVATFGDSITDGFMGQALAPLLPSLAPIGQDVRYPDQLQRRVLAAGLNARFVSAAISGNRLLSGPFIPMFGPAGVARLERDVLSLPGLTDALILIGINDLGFSANPSATETDLVTALTDMIRTMHAAQIRVTLGTLTPSGGASNGLLHGSARVDAARKALNGWIRSSGVPDHVVDFDACLQDPATPSRLLPAYDSGDHLHPSTEGYAAMSRCVDLDFFR